ncbi:MAG TPA: DegT/DnrJ/EryC1/StrS family aminotransferase [Bryobacteraceae bacterium]|nr:DegT/DnrJ/EryC1/StrS family aminotransferase [Bryobacteraceae bacterium]
MSESAAVLLREAAAVAFAGEAYTIDTMILPNDFAAQWEDLGRDLTAAFAAVGSSGWYILGAEVKAFEADLAQFWGLGHAVGVASGLDAIEIGLRVLGCGPGDKVLTSPISAFATVLAILRMGALPVFADCDSQGLIDLDQAAEVLRRDEAIRFMVPVHLYGFSLDLERLRRLRERYGILMVEDCAQSIGARWGGSATGSAGQVAATSFYPTKNLGALGDGGALLMEDEALRDRARVLRDYGQTAKYRHEVIGFNSRLDELQAALLRRVLLPRVEGWTERRRTIADRYARGIVNSRMVLPAREGDCEPVWHLFPIRVHGKKELMSHMRDHGIVTAEHYPFALADQPAMTSTPYEAPLGLEVSRAFCASQVSLPIHPYLTDAQVDTVIAACNAWEG